MQWNTNRWGPLPAYLVTLYHVIIIVGASFLFYRQNAGDASAGTGSEGSGSGGGALAMDWDKILLAVLWGALGGAVIASRFVVRAVRQGKYDTLRILWQVITPLHSALLAAVGFFVVRAGLLTLASPVKTQEPQYSYFVIGFSFLVGIASESFIERLIAAAQSLFGASDQPPRNGNMTERDAGAAGVPGGRRAGTAHQQATDEPPPPVSEDGT